MTICTIDGCERPLRARGWCATHWSRWQRHGDPLDDSPRGKRPVPVADRLWAKVDKQPGGCWVWTGATIRGYGAINLGGGRVVYTHRLAYELLVGPIPEGLTLDHLCRNPPCCNPEHLEPVTQSVNSRRAARLTDEQVAEMRRRWAAGETQRSIAESYAVHPAHVSRIVRGLLRNDFAETRTGEALALGWLIRIEGAA